MSPNGEMNGNERAQTNWDGVLSARPLLAALRCPCCLSGPGGVGGNHPWWSLGGPCCVRVLARDSHLLPTGRSAVPPGAPEIPQSLPTLAPPLVTGGPGACAVAWWTRAGGYVPRNPSPPLPSPEGLGLCWVLLGCSWYTASLVPQIRETPQSATIVALVGGVEVGAGH